MLNSSTKLVLDALVAALALVKQGSILLAHQVQDLGGSTPQHHFMTAPRPFQDGPPTTAPDSLSEA